MAVATSMKLLIVSFSVPERCTVPSDVSRYLSFGLAMYDASWFLVNFIRTAARQLSLIPQPP